MKKIIRNPKTSHNHITMQESIAGGSPIIKGTRTTVAAIAGYYLMGLSPEEIERELPHLSLAEIFNALAFYLDNREAIDREIDREREELVLRDYPPGRY